MQVQNSTIQQIIDNMPAAQRREVLTTLKGTVTQQVVCLSKICKGRVIANIIKFNNNKVQIRAVVDKKGNTWCKVHRFRFDGFLGFKCACGNDSRLAKEEEGVFDYKGTIPDQVGMQKVFDRVSKNQPKYEIINGSQEIDGFALIDIDGGSI